MLSNCFENSCNLAQPALSTAIRSGPGSSSLTPTLLPIAHLLTDTLTIRVPDMPRISSKPEGWLVSKAFRCVRLSEARVWRISRTCRHAGHALAYAEFVANAATQKTLYANSGGQPGHRAAWLDPALNVATNNFFATTLATLDAAWVRPRFPGFIAFQDAASKLVHTYLIDGGSERRGPRQDELRTRSGTKEDA